MGKINLLINKYFLGETSLEEEKYLKKYFKSDQVDEHHEAYKFMFNAFENELEIIAPQAESIQLVSKHKKIKLKIFSFAGIAASLIFAFFIFAKQQNSSGSYAIVNGKKVESEEFVLSYANEKLKMATQVLEDKMKLVESIDNLNQYMEPVYKIEKLIINADNLCLKFDQK